MLARRALILLPSLAAGTWAGSHIKDPQRFLYFSAALPVRLARDVSFAASTLADYKYNLRGLQGDSLQSSKSACHQRGADRLVKLCFKNGGIYIKLGQHIGMLDHLLPEQYVHTARRHMLDKCPISSFEDVSAIIEEDLGLPVEELFVAFDPFPVASASLAQVHKAIDTDGRLVAVKVQHRGLRESSAVDIKTIEILVNLVKKVSPTADYSWLVEEAKENLPKELNFLHEASNAERCAHNIKNESSLKGKVVVPKIDRTRTSPRVLTMDYIEGCKVTDKDGVKLVGAAPSSVATLLAKTFAAMIFKWGDVHADPHAANVFVRQTPKEELLPGSPTWQLVLLDHGLYRQLDDELRLRYAELWKHLVFGNKAGIIAASRALIAGDSIPLFVSMLTQRTWKDITDPGKGAHHRLAIRRSPDDRERMQRYASTYAMEINDMLGRIPRPLLLLLKTADCLRAVDVELGTTPVNSFGITARACIGALSRQKRSAQPGLRGYAADIVDALCVEVRMTLLRMMEWLSDKTGSSRGEVLDESDILLLRG